MREIFPSDTISWTMRSLRLTSPLSTMRHCGAWPPAIGFETCLSAPSAVQYRRTPPELFAASLIHVSRLLPLRNPCRWTRAPLSLQRQDAAGDRHAFPSLTLGPATSLTPQYESPAVAWTAAAVEGVAAVVVVVVGHAPVSAAHSVALRAPVAVLTVARWTMGPVTTAIRARRTTFVRYSALILPEIPITKAVAGHPRTATTTTPAPPTAATPTPGCARTGASVSRKKFVVKAYAAWKVPAASSTPGPARRPPCTVARWRVVSTWAMIRPVRRRTCAGQDAKTVIPLQGRISNAAIIRMIRSNPVIKPIALSLP